MSTIVTDRQSVRLLEISELANAVAEAYWEGDRLDPEKVLKAKGVRICRGDFAEAFDGLLEWRQDRFYVYCNTYDRRDERIRFTLGHEAGHFFIDEHRNALIEGSAPSHPCWPDFRSDNPMEREADVFAAHLLLPASRLEKAARRCAQGLAGIVQLSAKFGTSITATALRYLDEVLREGILIYWNNEGFRWRRLSQEWWFESRQKRTTISSSSELLPGCATDRLMRGEAPDENGIFRAGSTASAWFPRIGMRHSSNAVLREEAIKLGKFGFLTLLYPDKL